MFLTSGLNEGVFESKLLAGKTNQTYLVFLVEFRITESGKNHSPHGIELWANISIMVESVFHGARPVKYRHRCDTNAPAVRIFHGAKDAKFGDIGKYISFTRLAEVEGLRDVSALGPGHGYQHTPMADPVPGSLLPTCGSIRYIPYLEQVGGQ